MTSSSAAADTKELTGKVALITGAAKNIGRAIALELVAGGAAVAINTRSSREEAEQLAQQIRTAGGNAAAHIADIADASAVKTMVQEVVARFGRLDLLVLNASVRTEVPFLELTYEEWRRPLAISLDGSFYLAQACIPHMINAGGGAIVTLAGMTALSGAKRRVHGSVAKHGMVGFTRALARELAEDGIRVNCVAPGQMNTVRASHRSARADPKISVPLGRLGEPGEIATAVRFLCGPGAGYITGQTLHVNGGQMMF
jgi:3-oxoacyl-[acyl-carrier protein] reductase